MHHLGERIQAQRVSSLSTQARDADDHTCWSMSSTALCCSPMASSASTLAMSTKNPMCCLAPGDTAFSRAAPSIRLDGLITGRPCCDEPVLGSGSLAKSWLYPSTSSSMHLTSLAKSPALDGK